MISDHINNFKYWKKQTNFYGWYANIWGWKWELHSWQFPPELRFPEASWDRAHARREAAFGKRSLSSGLGSGWIVSLLGRFASPDSHKNITDFGEHFNARSAATDSHRCISHFFCTSSSIFRAAVFFGSTFSSLFRSATQVLMSCDRNMELNSRRLSWDMQQVSLHSTLTYNW